MCASSSRLKGCILRLLSSWNDALRSQVRLPWADPANRTTPFLDSPRSAFAGELHGPESGLAWEARKNVADLCNMLAMNALNTGEMDQVTTLEESTVPADPKTGRDLTTMPPSRSATRSSHVRNSSQRVKTVRRSARDSVSEQ